MSEPHERIPDDYDLRKIVKQLLYELWRYRVIDEETVQKIKDAGKHKPKTTK